MDSKLHKLTLWTRRLLLALAVLLTALFPVCGIAQASTSFVDRVLQQVAEFKAMAVAEAAPYISVDKETYELGEPIMVTAASNNGDAWVGLYPKDADTNGQSNIWYYVSVANGTAYDLYQGKVNSAPGVGEYKVVLFDDGSYNQVEELTKYITITEAAPKALVTDKTTYGLDDPIMVTATSDLADAWVGLYAKGDTPSATTPSYFWYSVSDHNGAAVDIKTTTPNTERAFAPGEYEVILFGDGGYTNIVERMAVTVQGEAAKNLETDKQEYGFNDPIMVTATCSATDAWVGMFKKGETPGTAGLTSFYWYYVSEHSGTPVDIKTTENQRALLPGEYTIFLFNSGGYTVQEQVDIKVTLDSSISTDKKTYQLGEPVMVTAASEAAGSWVGIIDRGGAVNEYYRYFYVNATGDPVDILSAEAGSGTIVPGNYSVVLFVGGGYDVDKVASITIDAYSDPTWTWSDDNKTATATFESVMGKLDKKDLEAEVSEKTTPATCTEAGETVFTATVKDIDLVTASGKTEFSDTKNVEIEKLGHAWGDWTVVTPATEESEGLERRVCDNDKTHFEERPIPIISHVHSLTHVEAKAATCEEDGNTEYWECSGCGKYFSDAEGTAEIEDKTSVVVKASGHKYGDWTFDEQTKTHKRICANDETHVESENCTFDDGALADGVRTYTCSVCGGTYEEVVLATDKASYGRGEPVMVTTNYDGAGAWVGLYKKGETYNPSSGGAVSIYWYYIGSQATNTNNILDHWSSGNNRYLEDGPAEYTIVLFEGDNYNKLTSVDVTIDNTPAPYEADLTIDKGRGGEYKVGEPIKVTATSNADGAWAGLYPYNSDGGLDTLYYFYFNVAEHNGEAFDILQGTVGPKTDLVPGHYKIILFKDNGYSVDTSHIVSFYIIDTYGDPTWSWNADHSVATATFASLTDATDTKSVEVSGDAISYAIDTPATCEVDGKGIYTATVKAADLDFAVSSSAETFTGTDEVAIDAIGHKWGELVVDTAATETEDGLGHRVCENDPTHIQEEVIPSTGHIHSLTHVEAKAATCEEPGNSEYWECSGCGLFFADADATTQIEDKASVVIKALDHAYGDWTFDEATHKHTKTCANDASHTVTEDCVFTEKVENGVATYTCSVCGGTYTKTLLSTDKTVYEHGEPVMVTANLDGPGWVGLYKKGDKYGEGAGAVKSIYWYYLNEASNPNNILKARDENGRSLTNGTNDYTVMLFSGENYDFVTSVDVTITRGSGQHGDEGTLTTDKDQYTLFEPIMVNAFCSNESSWVGMYKKGELVNPDAGGAASIFWYYLSEEDNPVNILETRDENGRANDYGVGEYTLVLFGTGSYDQILDQKDITIVEDSSHAGMITASVNDVAITADDHREFETGTPVYISATVDGEVGTSRIVVYNTLLTEESTFAGQQPAYQATIASLDGKPFYPKGDGKLAEGDYTVVVFGNGGTSDIRALMTFTVSAPGTREEVTIEPTCSKVGQKVVYREGQDPEYIVLPALGHKWGDWTFDEKTHKHSRVCSRDESHVETEDCVFGEPTIIKEATNTTEGLAEYTCTICGGTYQEAIPMAKKVLRVFGSDRYQTALKAADELKRQLGVEKFDTIVVASGKDFADALSGSYLATIKHAPILLVEDSSIKTVANYINANLNEGGTVYILGGELAVSKNFESAVSGAKRVAGKTRFDTNLAILKEAGVEGGDILVARGMNFADCLSASATGRPILMVNDSGKLTADQKAFVNAHKGNAYYILGGTYAVKQSLEAELNGIISKKATRVAGNTRFDTSVAIAEQFFANPTSATLAYGLDFPDALSGGSLAALTGSPMLLTTSSNPSAAVNYCDKHGIESGYVLGGYKGKKGDLISDKAAELILGSTPIAI